MMGPGMIRAVNAAATVQGLIEKNEDFFYTAEEIADELAYEAGWNQNEDGTWSDAYGDESGPPINELHHHNLPDSLQDKIVDACVKRFKENEEGT